MILQNKVINADEYGDYQTPECFAKKVCEKLKNFYGLCPDAVFEPTFGIGSFFPGVISTFQAPFSLFGIEINPDYYNIGLSTVRELSPSIQCRFYNNDIFSFDYSEIKAYISKKDTLLIIGNPPWVTNSQLSSIQSYNIPLKSNIKGLAGIEAITGKGNFDIAEYIILQLLSEFSMYNCTLAMLCKTIVAKNIMRDIDLFNFTVSNADLFTFSASEVFGVNCDAGLFVLTLGSYAKKTCSVYDFATNNFLREFGWIEGTFYSDTRHQSSCAKIDGQCQLEWRQGIKHDCSRIMELESADGVNFQNKLGEICRFTLGRFVYPLVKSSDIKSYAINRTRKYVVVPQKWVNEETSKIEHEDPVVWNYLTSHKDSLASRRSIIYKNSPKYSVFGVGSYSFSKYKIGVSGFYKEPVFSLLWGEHPIMMDDTCYFLSFDKLKNALITLSLLNSNKCVSFLKSIAFLDSKRPYTKDILRRIDLIGLSDTVGFTGVRSFIEAHFGDYPISERDFIKYCDNFNHPIASPITKPIAKPITKPIAKPIAKPVAKTYSKVKGLLKESQG
jgi:hypothetical protein